MNDNLTLVTVVLDRSGSMAGIARDMEGGLDTFIKEQAALPGECRLTLTRFDDQYEVVADYVDAKTYNEVFRLEPRANTALNDAIGKTINIVGAKLAALPEDERPGKVICMIVTDGGENASREYSTEQVKEMIKKQESEFSWEFNYLGANQDAFAVAGGYGIKNAMNYAPSAKGAVGAFAAMSSSTLRSRTGGSSIFTDEEQATAMETTPTS